MVFEYLIQAQPGIFYLLFAIALAAIELALIFVARRYMLGPPITSRSSHTKFTPTGGGIIWVIAAIVGTAMYGDLSKTTTWIFMGGIVALAVISYIDDLHPLPPIPRLISQIIVMALSFKNLCYPEAFDIYLLMLFFGVGIINAINFIDGIRGMLALYGIVLTASLLYLFYLNPSSGLSYAIPVLGLVLIAQIVFAIFNITDTIFAGDTGAITLGYILVYFTILMVLATKDASIILFFSVCIFDVGLTTVQRLFSGESILEPHRMHIYQKLITEKKFPPLAVALIYSLLQLLIDALYFLIPASQHWTYFLMTCALLTILYFVVRFSFRKQNV